MNVDERLIEVAAGVYVEADALRIAEKINEYDPNLRLKYCEPGKAGLTDAPYKLVEVCNDGMERIVFDIWELDDRVIEKLYAADTRYQDINAILDTTNAKAKADDNRRYKEMHEEALDIAKSVFGSSKDVYKVTDPHTGNKLTIREGQPVEVKQNVD